MVLWWTEGAKSRKDKRWRNAWTYNVEITNTDPNIIKMFLEFLRKDIKINESRLKLQLHIHEGDDQKKIESCWSKITKIPKERFTKTIIRPKGKKVGKSKGTCKIRYCKKETYYKLKGLLEDILRNFNGL